MTADPDDAAYQVVRHCVRVVVVDALDRILQFRTREFGAPDLGTWWELPGGGIEPGETAAQAAVRELYEETGIVTAEAAVRAPNWIRSATFVHRGVRRLQHEVVVLVRLSTPGPELDTSRQLRDEREDYIGYEWRPVGDVISSGERCYPGRLPDLLADFLTGVDIDEPLERFN